MCPCPRSASSSPSLSLLPPLHRLLLLWAFPRASVRGSSITILAAASPVGGRPFCARPVCCFADTENGAKLIRTGRSTCFAGNFGAKVAAAATISSAHARGLSGTTKQRLIKKPNSSPNQIHTSGQRVAKKKAVCSLTQDSRHGISPKALDLVKKVLMLPDVKEIVSKELDKWAISEGKFPIAYVKQAIQVFEREENWSRIIQMSEWLVQKDEGKTLRTFEVFLKALDMHQRADDAEAVWKNDIVNKSWSVPTRLVAYVLNMFERHHKPVEVIKLFTLMEDNGRKLDKKCIKGVARAYEEAGFLEMKKQILVKYNMPVKASQDWEECKA